MTGNENIKELRCSLIWISSLSKKNKLANQKCYFKEFNSAAEGKAGWSLPWLAKPRIDFWKNYLEIKSLLSNSSEQNKYVLSYPKAIGCIVPLRGKKGLGKIKLEHKVPNEKVSSGIEGFVYPHGVSCIITLHWRSQVGLPLQEIVDRLIILRNTKFSCSISTSTKSQTLKDISCDALSYLSSEIDGGKLLNVQPDPFSIVTVVEAENAPLKSEPVEDGLFHFALDALCSKMPASNWDWRNDANPVSLEKALLTTKGQDGVLYARGRGRVVWLPRYFRQHCLTPRTQTPGEHKFIFYLGRYHRNLTLATMQTAYLSVFLKYVNDLRQQRELTYDEREWERSAAGAIGRLFGKCKDSYMSESLPRQITLSNFIDSINASRGKYGLSPLRNT
jgi:hypothetical protein